MLEVELTGVRDGRTATGSGRTVTKLLHAPLQKHSSGGCTTDMLPSNCHRRRNIISLRYTLFYVVAYRSRL